MPEVPAHEKVLVDPAFLDDQNHGAAECQSCHSGDPEGTTRAIAHVGMVADPSVEVTTNVCAGCHDAIAESSANSLHTTLAGLRQSMMDRNGGTMSAELETAFENHCGRCHSSCGDCHISVPAAAGGGLLAGHRVKKTPPMTLVCTACHGSRVSDEYKGNNAGISADVHYFKGMQCTSCHTGTEMHATDDPGVTHRYQVTAAPSCTDCHPDDTSFKATPAHAMHRETDGSMLISCQVCHSVAYKNCSSCHVSLDAENNAIYEVNAPTHESTMAFKIGLNPSRDELHSTKWITVRHVPIDPQNYEYYGSGLLSTFAAKPTWRLATPHNIQRVTPQNSSCNACHGVRELFLSADDLAPYEVDANAGVVVSDTAMP